jgi:hypothetical protein
VLFALSPHPPFPDPAFIVKAFQSFHNFIAHLRLYLDAYIRNACFIAHMCTCIPQLLAVLRNQYIIAIHTFHDVLSQKEGEEEYCIAINGIRGVMLWQLTEYGTHSMIREMER